MNEDAQQELLDSAFTLIRQFVPNASRVRVRTSDQDLFGFALVDVTAGGSTLKVTDPSLLEDLIDELREFLILLPWDGIVGEDPTGDAQLALPTNPVPPKRVLTCLTCAFTSSSLARTGNAEHLRVDRAHYPIWCSDDEKESASV